MLGKIIYILGIIVAVWCVLDIFKSKKVELLGKIIIAALVVITSWVGAAVYYFLVRQKIQ